MNWRKYYNMPMIALLRSPLNRLAGEAMMLITYRGRTTGNTYTTPVKFIRHGECLLVISLRSRTWWRNLRGGATIGVRLHGTMHRATGEAIEDPDRVQSDILTALLCDEKLRQYFKIDLDVDGKPGDQSALEEIAGNRVTVRISNLVEA